MSKIKETKITRSTPRYLFIIETDSYAGNFERDMTAWCTGHIGDCQVGSHYVKLFNSFGYVKWGDDYNSDENHLSEYIECRVCPEDNSHCSRPCTGYYNEEGEYNNVCIYFAEEPPQEIIDIIKERAHGFSRTRQKQQELKGQNWNNEDIKVFGFKWIKIVEEHETKEI